MHLPAKPSSLCFFPSIPILHSNANRQSQNNHATRQQHSIQNININLKTHVTILLLLFTIFFKQKQNNLPFLFPFSLFLGFPKSNTTNHIPISFIPSLRTGMEAIISDPNPVRVKRKTLQTVLEQCQRALELINASSDDDEDDVSDSNDEPLPSTRPDPEADQLCDLLKSRLECPDFLEKLECAQASVYQNPVEEGNSWDLISENDLWEGDDSEEEDYVLVRQDDIVDGIACFMAAYLLSLKKTKDLTPNQLQDALSKTFSVKKKKGKLRKAWDGSKVIYNVASWGATAIGIYQNPVILRAATKAFWTSCQVISKLL